MELKLVYPSLRLAQATLLIVPYGIEITYLMRKTELVTLLIVPYGIEISTNERYSLIG